MAVLLHCLQPLGPLSCKVSLDTLKQCPNLMGSFANHPHTSYVFQMSNLEHGVPKIMSHQQLPGEKGVLEGRESGLIVPQALSFPIELWIRRIRPT